MSSAGTVVITAQLSYGAGLLLLVLLGDLFEQRRLIVSMTVLFSPKFLSAFAPSLTLLLLGTAVTGLFSVSAQVLVPMAASLTDPQSRGRVVGTLMSGLLLGILLARTVAGALFGRRLAHHLPAGRRAHVYQRPRAVLRPAQSSSERRVELSETAGIGISPVRGRAGIAPAPLAGPGLGHSRCLPVLDPGLSAGTAALRLF